MAGKNGSEQGVEQPRVLVPLGFAVMPQGARRSNAMARGFSPTAASSLLLPGLDDNGRHRGRIDLAGAALQPTEPTGEPDRFHGLLPHDGDRGPDRYSAGPGHQELPSRRRGFRRTLILASRQRALPWPWDYGDFFHAPVDRQSSLIGQPDVFIRAFGLPLYAKHRITAVNQPARHRVEVLRGNRIRQRSGAGLLHDRQSHPLSDHWNMPRLVHGQRK